jgi:hypothetical protein
MTDNLETLLSAARSARDWGNAVLALGILLEVAVDALWPKQPISFPVLHRRATTQLQKRQFPICTLKGFCVVLAGLIVLFGLYRERTEGKEADDLADQIRTNLTRWLVALNPRNLTIDQEKSLLAITTASKGLPAVVVWPQRDREVRHIVGQLTWGPVSVESEIYQFFLDDCDGSRYPSPNLFQCE